MTYDQIKNTFPEFDFKQAWIAVRDQDNKFGLMSGKNTINYLPNELKNDITDEFGDTEGAYVSKHDGKLLLGPLFLDSLTFSYAIEHMEDSELSHLLRDSIKDFKEDIDNGFFGFPGSEDIKSYFYFEYLRSLSWKTGSRISSILQEVESNIIPTGAHKSFFDLGRAAIRVSRSSVDLTLKPYIDQNAIEGINSLIPVVFEIVHSFESGLNLEENVDITHRQLTVSDILFGLHDSQITIDHIINVLKILEPQKIGESFYDSANPETWLKNLVHFSCDEQGQITINNLDSFSLRNAILKLIKNVFDRDSGDASYISLESLLGSELFTYLSNNQFQGESFGAPIVDKDSGIDETILIDRIDLAMEKMFGSVGLFFIKQGLVSFSRVSFQSSSYYTIEPFTHSYHLLREFASEFQLRPVYAGKIRNDLPIKYYSVTKAFEKSLIAFITTGHQERLKTVDLTGKKNDVYYYSKITPSMSPFLDGIFDGIDFGNLKMSTFSFISSQIIELSYSTYNSERKRNELFIKGKETLKKKIRFMLSDQVSLNTIKVKFKEEIDTMHDFASNGVSWEECARIKRLQVIDYMTREYTNALYYPVRPLSPSRAEKGLRTYGDISHTFKNLLKDPVVDTTFIPFVPQGTTPSNKFFADFWLTFSLREFTRTDISTILPSLSYSYNLLPSLTNRFKGDMASLYDVTAMFSELKEQISSLYKNLRFYFADYIGSTDVHEFGIKFYLQKPKGIDKFTSLLPRAVGTNIRKDASGNVVEELKGEFLEFKINNNLDLDKMVANIIYYMLKYDCLVAVNEGKALKRDNDSEMKYALIASPSGLFTGDYLLSSDKDRPSLNIKNSGLSEKAKQLYKDLFDVDFNMIYSGFQLNEYTKIFKYGSGYSPYLMTNSHELKILFDISIGRNVLSNLFDKDQYT